MNFEKASRLKLRYASNYGVLTTEDLWDLKLTDLNKVAQSVYKQIKESEEVSFITERTSKDVEAELKLEILKHIISVKKEEAEKKALAKERLAKKQQIMNLIVEKENEALSQTSIDDLKRQLAELD